MYDHKPNLSNLSSRDGPPLAAGLRRALGSEDRERPAAWSRRAVERWLLCGTGEPEPAVGGARGTGTRMAADCTGMVDERGKVAGNVQRSFGLRLVKLSVTTSPLRSGTVEEVPRHQPMGRGAVRQHGTDDQER